MSADNRPMSDAAPDIDQPRSDDDDQETINPNRHLTGGGTAPDLTDESLTLDDITDLQTGRTFSEEQQ